MSLLTSDQNKIRLLYGFLLAGILLRIVGLFYFPTGMEGDEVVVVYWGRKWISTGQWLLISYGELPAWETPSAYIFGALDLMGIDPRIGAVGISFLELWMCYLWTERRAGKQTALIASTFLSLMPWHFFFSYVLGPCVAGFWTSIYLLDIKNPLGRSLANLGGIFYYVSFRVILVWGGLVNLVTRRWRPLGIDVISGLVSLGIIFLMGAEHIQGFFFKGSYLVTERGPVEWAHHYLNSVLLWWVPPLQVYWQGLTQYSMDDVGFGFANALGFQSPLSFGTSLFFGWGLYLCYLKKEHRDVLGLFVLSVAMVGFSPSYIHFPFILPVVAFIAAVAAQHSLNSNKKNFLILLFSLLLSLASVVFVLSNFGKTDRWKTFTGSTDAITKVLPQYTNNEPYVWTSGYDFWKARLDGDRAGVPVVAFYISFSEWLADITSKLYETQGRWVFIQTTSRFEHPRPEKEALLKDAYQDYLKRLAFFEGNTKFKSKKSIIIDGIEMGVLYEVDR